MERWITPALFDGLSAWDEHGFCEELENAKVGRLKEHRENFITADDFNWIAKHGLDAVRIPVGYWIFDGQPPYVGAIEYLDFALEAAAKEDLKVIIDLHAAPGSQNGWKHSGKEEKIRWHKGRGNIAQTLDVIERLAQRYKNHPALCGIELLNEPSFKIPQKVLVDFYQKGYERVRRYCREDVAVIISDAFRPYDWQDALLAPSYKNVWLDCHLYQVFTPEDKALSVEEHLQKVQGEWSGLIKKLQESRPVLIGEWSAALDLKGLNQTEQEEALLSYADAQIATFSQAKGWFYWTYKTERDSAWNLRCMIEKDLINLKEKEN